MLHQITEAYFAFGEYTHTLRLISKLIELRVGYAQRIRRAQLDEPHLTQLRKYDARCCTIFTEGYRSGHNEAVLKICSREFLQSAKKSCYA